MDRLRPILTSVVCGLAGCSGASEAPDPVQTLLTPTGGAFALAVDEAHVYLRAETNDVCRIDRLPTAGGPVESLISDLPCGRGLALDESHIYWTEAAADGTGIRVRRATKDGGSVETLLDDFGERRGGTALIVVDRTLFFSAVVDDVGQPWRVDVAGGTPSAFEVPFRSMASDYVVGDGWVYWTDFYSDSGRIWRGPIGGGSAEILSAGSTDAGQLVLDDTHVFWTGRDALHLAPREGGQSTRLVDLGGEATYGLAQLGDRLVVGSVPREAPGNPRSGVWSVSKTGDELQFVSEHQARRLTERGGAVYWLSDDRILRYAPGP